MKGKVVILVALLGSLVVALLAAGCSKNATGPTGAKPEATAEPAPPSEKKEPVPPGEQKDMQNMKKGEAEKHGETEEHGERSYDVPPDAPRLEIAMKNMRFDPPEFRLRVKEPVRFAVSNGDSVAHDFMVTGENGFDTGLLQPGEKKEIGWIPEKPGTYEAFCSVPGHRELGMTARITVAP